MPITPTKQQREPVLLDRRAATQLDTGAIHERGNNPALEVARVSWRGQ